MSEGISSIKATQFRRIDIEVTFKKVRYALGKETMMLGLDDAGEV